MLYNKLVRKEENKIYLLTKILHLIAYNYWKEKILRDYFKQNYLLPCYEYWTVKKHRLRI